MKGNSLLFIVVATLAIAAVAAFVAYNLGLGIEVPGNYLYFGKTVDASGLYNMDQFSWYTYDQITHREYPTGPNIVHITLEWDNQTYNGSIMRHMRQTISGNSAYAFTQVDDSYFGADGYLLAHPFQVFFHNGTWRNNGSFNDTGSTWHKFVPTLREGYTLAPRGRETITVGNVTYDCDKYYLPLQNVNGSVSTLAEIWFSESVPLPVKMQEHNPEVTFELTGWG